MISGIATPLFNFLAMFFLSTKYEYFVDIANIISAINDGVQVSKLYYVNDMKSSTAITNNEIELSEVGSINDKTSKAITSRDSGRDIVTTIENFEIDVTELMPTLCVDISMLLTFGLASPLLAVVITFKIITNVFLFRLALGRYISIVSKIVGTGACYRLLESTFGDEWRCLSTSWWIMSILISMFWSLFVFDILGDIDPNSGIAAAVLMMILIPLLFVSIQMMLYINPDSSTNSNRFRDCFHDIALSIHRSIWKYVFRTSSISHDVTSSNSNSSNSSSSSSGYGNDDRVSTVQETISPLRSTNHDVRCSRIDDRVSTVEEIVSPLRSTSHDVSRSSSSNNSSNNRNSDHIQ